MATKNGTKALLQKVMKPWAITGPTASKEFVEAVPNATDYRKVAPATMPVRPAVPHADPDLVFKVEYHTRDRKRSGIRKVHQVDPAELAAELQGLPPTPDAHGRSQYVMGKACRMDDEPGDGYQK